MGALLSRVVESGVSREAATAVLGLLVGWFISRPAPVDSRPRTRPALEAVKRKEGDEEDGKFHFAIPYALDIRRQAQLVGVSSSELSFSF